MTKTVSHFYELGLLNSAVVKFWGISKFSNQLNTDVIYETVIVLQEVKSLSGRHVGNLIGGGALRWSCVASPENYRINVYHLSVSESSWRGSDVADWRAEFFIDFQRNSNINAYEKPDFKISCLLYSYSESRSRKKQLVKSCNKCSVPEGN